MLKYATVRQNSFKMYPVIFSGRLLVTIVSKGPVKDGSTVVHASSNNVSVSCVLRIFTAAAYLFP